MWRSARSIISKTYPSAQKAVCPKCQYASSSANRGGGGGGGKTAIALIAAAGLGIGGTIAYAKYDPDFQKLLEDNIPYSDVVLRSIPDWESSPPLQQKDSNQLGAKVKEKAIESGLMRKKQERLNKEESKPSEVAEFKESEKQTTVAEKEEQKPQSMPKAAPKSITDDELVSKRTLTQQEIDIAAQNTAIEKAVKDSLDKVDKLSREAHIAQQAAVEAIQYHTKSLYHALDAVEDANEDQVWNQANIASNDRITALNLASKKVAETKTAIDKLKNHVEKGHELNTTTKNPVLYAGEETINRVLNQIQSGESEIIAAQAEAEIATDYKFLVDKGKEKFQKELEAVLPDIHSRDKAKMTEEELNLLIVHAHKRIEHLQKQLAKQQVTEMRRIKKAVKLQKKESENAFNSRVASELKEHQNELELDFQKRIATLRDEFEAEMRQQLRRQAAAHSDHLQDVLQVQQQELDRKHNMELEDKLLHQKGIFISEISGSMARLKGIEEYLKARAELDEAARKAQALWLACQTMKHVIKTGSSGEPKPLAREIAAIKDAVGEENTYISNVLAGIPAQAIQRGVFTDQSLKHRFSNVNRICRRVAMIDDNGGSLYRYLLSYLQSFFIIDAKVIPKEELQGKVAVNPAEWDTFDILSRINHCLQRDELEQALRYANQLRGEPGNVARDWIQELSLLLEARQAVDALIAHAAAIGVQAYH